MRKLKDRTTPGFKIFLAIMKFVLGVIGGLVLYLFWVLLVFGERRLSALLPRAFREWARQDSVQLASVLILPLVCGSLAALLWGTRLGAWFMYYLGKRRKPGNIIERQKNKRRHEL